MIRVPLKQARLFYFDETTLCWCPDTGRTYQLPNEQLKVDSPGKNQVLYLLGSVCYPTGEGLYELYERKRHQEVAAHFEHLMEMFSDSHCFVVWDNASQHTTEMLLPFLFDNHQRLTTVALPTYSPHLNLIERLWRYMRDQITRNHFYDSFAQLCESLMVWFERLPFSRFQSLMGLKTQQALLAA